MRKADDLRHASIFIPPKGGALPANPTALLLHGLTGTPDELSDLGEELAREGYRVIIPCLPGHGTSVRELRSTTLDQYLDFTRALGKYLSNRGSVVVGSSFGSLLGLWIALESPQRPRAVVLISPPFRLRSAVRERVLSMLARMPERSINRLGYARKKKRAVPIPRPAYPVHSVGSAARLVRLRQMVMSRLSEIVMPVLIVQDPFDHHVHPDGAEQVVERFSSEEVDTVWFPHGQHELTVGPEADRVTIAVREFLRRARSQNAA